MPIKAKANESGAPAPRENTSSAAPATAEPNGPRVYRNNDDVEARLNPYIEATQERHERYQKLVKENPERAARLLSLKDLDYLELEHRVSKTQIQNSKAWLAQQPEDVQKRISERAAEVSHPMLRDMKIVRDED
jgi:hypothetical protein